MQIYHQSKFISTRDIVTQTRIQFQIHVLYQLIVH